MLTPEDTEGMRLAIDQARKSQEEGGIPIGCALILQDQDGTQRFKVLGLGHNERIQKSSPTLHGEISALENAGRLKPDIYRKATLYTTLSPCSMCSGAILLYKIPRVVIGENSSFRGEESLLISRGVEVVVVDDAICKDMMQLFAHDYPEEWKEDIGSR